MAIVANQAVAFDKSMLTACRRSAPMTPIIEGRRAFFVTPLAFRMPLLNAKPICRYESGGSQPRRLQGSSELAVFDARLYIRVRRLDEPA